MGSTLVVDDAHGAAIGSDVFAYVMQRVLAKDGTFRYLLWADMLLWPRATRKTPTIWRDYCDHWETRHKLPKGLNGATAAAVLHVIIGAMSPDDQAFNCFLNRATIARRAHTSERVVTRVLAWQRDAPSPLISMSQPGRTHDIEHGCHRFTLVVDPPAFAAARQVARAQKLQAANDRLDAFRSEELEDQKLLLVGGMSEAEYATRKAARLAAARGRLPRRAQLSPARPRPRLGAPNWRP